MNIESQVTSLELSKKLKEIGVKQESENYFHYCEECKNEYENYKGEFLDYKGHSESTSVFTIYELLEIIPKEINYYFLHINNIDDEWYIYYEDAYGTLNSKQTSDKSMANSLAMMIIYLVENGFMEVKIEQI